MATRTLLLTGSVPVAIPVVLLALLFVNARFLGPGERPLYSRISPPSTPPASDAHSLAGEVVEAHADRTPQILAEIRKAITDSSLTTDVRILP